MIFFSFFFQMSKRSAQQAQQCEVLLLGAPGAGKTLLVRRIKAVLNIRFAYFARALQPSAGVTSLTSSKHKYSPSVCACT